MMRGVFTRKKNSIGSRRVPCRAVLGSSSRFGTDESIGIDRKNKKIPGRTRLVFGLDPFGLLVWFRCCLPLLLLHDAGIHVVRQFLVDFGGLLVDRLVKGMLRSLEALFEVHEGDVLDETGSDDASHLRHFSELGILDVQPERIRKIPFHEGVVEGVEDGADEQCLSVDSRKEILVRCEFGHEDGTDLDDKLDKSRVIYQVDDVPVLPDALGDAVVETLDEGILFFPSLREETVVLPSLEELGKRRVTEVIVHCRHHAVAAEEGVLVLERLVAVDPPVGHGVELDVLCGDGVEPEHDQRIRCREIHVVHFCLDKFLGVQIDVDGKEVGDLEVQIVVDVGEIVKEKTRHVPELAVRFGLCEVMDDLGLFQAQRRDEALDVVGFRLLREAFLHEKGSKLQTHRCLGFQDERHGSDKAISPQEISELDVDVVHVELLGAFFSSFDSFERSALSSFSKHGVFFPVLLLFFHVGNQFAVGEGFVEFRVPYDLGLHDTETEYLKENKTKQTHKIHICCRECAVSIKPEGGFDRQTNTTNKRTHRLTCGNCLLEGHKGLVRLTRCPEKASSHLLCTHFTYKLDTTKTRVK